jgi:hypothetical protein
MANKETRLKCHWNEGDCNNEVAFVVIYQKKTWAHKDGTPINKRLRTYYCIDCMIDRLQRNKEHYEDMGEMYIPIRIFKRIQSQLPKTYDFEEETRGDT